MITLRRLQKTQPLYQTSYTKLCPTIPKRRRHTKSMIWSGRMTESTGCEYDLSPAHCQLCLALDKS